MSSDLENLVALFGQGNQAEAADEQEQEDRRNALRERVCTIGELVWKETEQAEPLLGPLVRRGMTTVIGGYGGAGKSTLALAMIEAIVTGDELFGFEGAGNKALIIDLEQGLSVAQKRVYEAFVGRKLETGASLAEILPNINLTAEQWENVIYADWQEGVDFSTEGPALDVLREILEKHRPDVVMIDPVYKLFMGADLNEQIGISAFVQQIQRLRTEYGFALILPMHPRKPGIQPTGLNMHSLYGSAVWSWWAETILMIRRKDEYSVLGFEKDRIGDGPAIGSQWDLTFEPGRGFRRSELGDLDSEKGVKAEIFKFLQVPTNVGRFFNKKELITALGLNPHSVDDAFKVMRKDMHTNKYPGLAVETISHKLSMSYQPEKGKLFNAPAVDTEEDW